MMGHIDTMYVGTDKIEVLYFFAQQVRTEEKEIDNGYIDNSNQRHTSPNSPRSQFAITQKQGTETLLQPLPIPCLCSCSLPALFSGARRCFSRLSGRLFHLQILGTDYTDNTVFLIREIRIICALKTVIDTRSEKKEFTYLVRESKSWSADRILQ